MTNEIDKTNINVSANSTKELREKIYTIRGKQVMLDSDLAEIYGYEVKRLNEQVKRNPDRFPDNFVFRLNKGEVNYLRSHNATANINPMSRSLPYAFTEKGTLMLATVLNSPQAIEASIQIIEAFLEMSRYLKISNQTDTYQQWILTNYRQDAIEADIRYIKSSMVVKSDLPDIIRAFYEKTENEEYCLFDGEMLKADIVYQSIYKRARKSIIVIDDYFSIKTLQHLAVASRKNVTLTIISGNKGGQTRMRQSDYSDFQTEYPGVFITFITSQDKFHDRYIVIDHDESNMKIYHCGHSSKNAGQRITHITLLHDFSEFYMRVKAALFNPPLTLT